MAFNLIPLLLVGGAAAYVVTSDKKKKEDAKDCPPTIALTSGELMSVSDRSFAKFGNLESPSKEASFFLNEVLPKGCSRGSKNSSFRISIPDLGKSWDVSIPDFYMLLFAGGMRIRTEEGRITKEQADRMWVAELDWYKKLTGKNFDLGKTAMDLAEVIVAATGKGSTSANAPTPSVDLVPDDACPANLVYDIDEDELIKLTEAEAHGRQLSPNDPFKIADVVFAVVAPPTCTKKDFKSVVTVNVGVGSGPKSSRTTDLAALYAMFVLDAAESINLGPAAMAAVESKIASNYQQLTGKPLVL